MALGSVDNLLSSVTVVTSSQAVQKFPRGREIEADTQACFY